MSKRIRLAFTASFTAMAFYTASHVHAAAIMPAVDSRPSVASTRLIEQAPDASTSVLEGNRDAFRVGGTILFGSHNLTARGGDNLSAEGIQVAVRLAADTGVPIVHRSQQPIVVFPESGSNVRLPGFFRAAIRAALLALQTVEHVILQRRASR